MSVIALDDEGVAERLREWAVRLTRRYGVQDADVEDVAHDILVAGRQVECGGTDDEVLDVCAACVLHGKCAVWAIFGGIGQHKIGDYWRRRYRGRVASGLADEAGDEDSLGLFALHDNESLVDTVAAALGRLPLQERQVILFRYFCTNCFTFSEIGEALGLSTGTVHGLHNSAVSALRKLIGEGK